MLEKLKRIIFSVVEFVLVCGAISWTLTVNSKKKYMEPILEC